MDPDKSPQSAADRLLDAALIHVPFEGWSETTLRAAAGDSGVDMGLARALFPRGGVDLALAYHRRGDDMMRDRLAKTDLDAMRYRERVSAAIRFRLEAVDDREAVRRGTTLFALPIHAADGARAIWGTADAIWTALGDTSTDINWYTKRATLSGVYSATVLYWLGDDSPGYAATWGFLDRRIDDVMRIEKFKARVQENPVSKALLAGPAKLIQKVRMPQSNIDLPGRSR
jgi:ubiquinone biosynthesis protein COQ9